MKSKHLPLLILLPLIWGCYYVASRQSVAKMSVFSVGIMIRFITMILLLIIMLRKKEMKLLFKTKGILKRLILIGILGFLLDLTAFLGLGMSSAGMGTAILKCDIIFVNLLSVFIYKEKFTKLDWGFSLLMLFGVFLVMDIDFWSFSITDKGNIFFVVSALFVSINAFVIKSVQLDKKNPAADNIIAFYNNFITMLLFLVSSAVMGTLNQISKIAGDKRLLMAVVAAGVGQALIYVVYYYNLRNNPVWIVKVFLLLMPIVSLFVSFILFGDMANRKQYLGIAIVLAGALGILLEQKKKTTAKTL